jgi:hypothetical protein
VVLVVLVLSEQSVVVVLVDTDVALLAKILAVGCPPKPHSH